MTATGALLLPTPADAARFWRRVDKGAGDGCWLWRAKISPDGYGAFQIGRRYGEHRTMRSHRLSYELVIGPIPDGLQLDHLCRVRHCVNPAHLEPVTLLENVRRGLPFRRRPTHCPSGHAYAVHGYARPDRAGMNCRECHRVANREYARRLRSASS